MLNERMALRDPPGPRPSDWPPGAILMTLSVLVLTGTIGAGLVIRSSAEWWALVLSICWGALIYGAAVPYIWSARLVPPWAVLLSIASAVAGVAVTAFVSQPIGFCLLVGMCTGLLLMNIAVILAVRSRFADEVS